MLCLALFTAILTVPRRINPWPVVFRSVRQSMCHDNFPDFSLLCYDVLGGHRSIFSWLLSCALKYQSGLACTLPTRNCRPSLTLVTIDLLFAELLPFCFPDFSRDTSIRLNLGSKIPRENYRLRIFATAGLIFVELLPSICKAADDRWLQDWKLLGPVKACMLQHVFTLSVVRRITSFVEVTRCLVFPMHNLGIWFWSFKWYV